MNIVYIMTSDPFKSSEGDNSDDGAGNDAGDDVDGLALTSF